MYYIWDSPQFTWDGAQMQPKAEQLHRIDPAKLGERRDPVFPNADPYLLSTTSCSCGRKGRETDSTFVEIRWLTSLCSNTLCVDADWVYRRNMQAVFEKDLAGLRHALEEQWISIGPS
jgi:hypothetical protein